MRMEEYIVIETSRHNHGINLYAIDSRENRKILCLYEDQGIYPQLNSRIGLVSRETEEEHGDILVKKLEIISIHLPGGKVITHPREGVRIGEIN